MNDNFDFDGTYSAEALSDLFNVTTLSNAIKKGSNALSEVLGSALNFFKGHEQALKLETQKPIDVRTTLKLVKDIPFARMADFPVPTVAGSPSSWNALLKTLTANQKELDGTIPNMLTPYNVWLANAISNPQELSSNSSIDIRKFTAVDYVSAKDALAKHFTKGDHGDMQLYGRVISKHDDWKPLVKGAEELLYGTEKDLNGKGGIHATMTLLVTRIEELFELIEKHPDEYGINDRNLKVLAERTIECARAVEMVSVNYYNIVQLHSSMADAAAKIKRTY